MADRKQFFVDSLAGSAVVPSISIPADLLLQYFASGLLAACVLNQRSDHAASMALQFGRNVSRTSRICGDVAEVLHDNVPVQIRSHARALGGWVTAGVQFALAPLDYCDGVTLTDHEAHHSGGDDQEDPYMLDAAERAKRRVNAALTRGMSRLAALKARLPGAASRSWDECPASVSIVIVGKP